MVKKGLCPPESVGRLAEMSSLSGVGLFLLNVFIWGYGQVSYTADGSLKRRNAECASCSVALVRSS